MQTKHLCVLNHIWTKGEVGMSWNQFKPSFKVFNWPIQGGTSFVDHLCYLCLVFCHALVSVHCCLVVTWREKTDLLALLVMFIVILIFFPSVSWDRCSIWMNRFLIIAVFFTFISRQSTCYKLTLCSCISLGVTIVYNNYIFLSSN